jgi:hypothetical protein
MDANIKISGGIGKTGGSSIEPVLADMSNIPNGNKVTKILCGSSLVMIAIDNKSMFTVTHKVVQLTINIKSDNVYGWGENSNQVS